MLKLEQNIKAFAQLYWKSIIPQNKFFGVCIPKDLSKILNNICFCVIHYEEAVIFHV